MSGEADAIQALRRDVNAAYPKRSKATDGTWGDTAHQARKSDHNTGDAMDITHDPAHGTDGNVIAAYAIRDPRVKYVIWNRRIYDKRNPGAGWQPYSKWKTLPHDHHVHVSVTQAGRADSSPWAFDPSKPAPDINIPGERPFEDADPAQGAIKGPAGSKAAPPAKAPAKAATKSKKKPPVKPKKKQRVADNTSPGIHIYDGEQTVVLGTKQWMAAHLESPHTGGGKIAKGASTVFVGPKQLQFARKGDPATDNLYVKEGQPNVLISVA